MRYLSVCSGVEAASQAWEPLGWKPVAFAEIEPFPCAVLASRFPEVPNLGDMSKIHYDRKTKELYNDTTRLVCDGGIDLLVGGTPCQSFSVAGKRAGLEGASGLAFHYARLLGEIQPRWFVWENVPGSLSSVTYCDQRDFNFLLQQFAVGGDASLGVRWDLCWRVLDTQYVRVERFARAIPQRRRRVFVVGHLAGGFGGGCEVLLEREGVLGHPAPRRVKGQGVAGDTAARTGGADRAESVVEGGHGVTLQHEHATTLQGGGGKLGQGECGVAISFNGGHSAEGGLGVDDGACQTMQSRMSAIEPTVAVGFYPAPREVLKRHHFELCDTFKNGTCPGHHNAVAIRTAENGVECMTPHDPQTERVYGTDAAYPSLPANSGGGQNRQAICIRTANTHANGCGISEDVTHTLDGANGQAICFQQNQRCEVRDLGGAAGALQSEPGMKQQNFLAIGIGRDAFNSGANAQMAQSISREVQPPLTARGPGGGVCVSGEPRKAITNLVTSKTAVEAFASPQDHDIDRGHMTECAPTIGAAAGTSGNNRTTIAYDVAGNDAVSVDAFNATVNADTSQTLTGARVDTVNNPCVAYHYAVRRITPIEGERLQGFADGWTRPCFTPDKITDALVDRFCGIHQNWAVINGKSGAKPPSRKKIRAWLEKISGPDCPDGPRYKAIGNSMSVNVMTWIGLRIQDADK